ncbi:uncharacterized protein TNCT_167481 [Trichonephila clavata]|uniref:Uncharacterized protein n=1 Tax=Trichonephila clavata TaxID=2740835 RepID=A0A8X6FVM8_TRICU|nr:uncharacterized protein TNCT_167481 [Trichonephila clavata]
MSIKFRPSLQQLANVRIALRFLYEFKFKAVCQGYQGLQEERKRREKFYGEFVLKRVHLLDLPNILKRTISGIVRALATEVREWYKCNKDFLPDAHVDYWQGYVGIHMEL